jgi:hypothetical protein
MYATNGHWLAVAKLYEEHVEEPGLVPIETADVAKVLAIVPDDALSKTTRIRAAESAITIDHGTPESVTLVTHEFHSPPIQDVVPPGLSKKKHPRLALSSELLRQSSKAFEAMYIGKGPVPIKFYAMGETALDASILWSPKTPGFFVVLMPMREDGKRDMRWWSEAAKAMNEIRTRPVPAADPAAAAE